MEQKKFKHPRFGTITLERSPKGKFFLLDQCGEEFASPSEGSTQHKACQRCWEGELVKDLTPIR